MATMAGTFGVVKIGTNTVANIKGWSLSHTQEIIDASVLGTNGSRVKMPTFRDWKASANGYWDPSDTNGQVAIENAMLNGTAVTIKIYPSATAGTPDTGDVYYTGQAYIAEYSPQGSFEGLVEASISFEGTGALTRGVEV